MDPDQALLTALQALPQDPATAHETLRDLVAWLDSGGFLPRWPERVTLTDKIADCADSPQLIAQITRVCWALDSSQDGHAAYIRAVFALNALHGHCVALTP